MRIKNSISYAFGGNMHSISSKYLEALVAGGFLGKVKVGLSNYYINLALNTILTRADLVDAAPP